MATVTCWIAESDLSVSQKTLSNRKRMLEPTRGGFRLTRIKCPTRGNRRAPSSLGKVSRLAQQMRTYLMFVIDRFQ